VISKEEIRHALTGPVFSVSTLFLPDGAIDYAGVFRLIDSLIDVGQKAIILTAGDSLFTVLTDQEVGELTKATVDHVAGRAVVVAADRSWWTGKTVGFAKYCREIGVDVLMVLPPDWASSCTPDTLVEHFAAVSKQIPVMLVTNFLEKWPAPRYVELFQKLRDGVPGIYAAKDDLCGELGWRLCQMVHDRWAVFASGNKRAILGNMPFGCDGYMSTFIGFKPDIAKEFWKAVVAHDEATIQRIIREVDIPFWDFLEASPGGFDAVIHGILELKGLGGRWRRKPYYSLNDDEMEKLSHFLRSKGWI
jgi:5-dehydro-4-deoxyglucarate dehydratase